MFINEITESSQNISRGIRRGLVAYKDDRKTQLEKLAVKKAIKHCPYYFAYGMNTDTKNMMVRTGDSTDMGAATLPRFQLEFKTYCDVVPSSQNDVVGVLWEMSANGLHLLDQREGYPTFYDRKVMRIRGQDGITYPAWVYYMTASYSKDGLKPPPNSYWETVNRGYNEHGIPTGQLDEAYNRAWDEYEEKNYYKQLDLKKQQSKYNDQYEDDYDGYL